MPREDDDDALLFDMARHARRAAEITAGKTLADYSADDILRYATERLIQIVGEAAWRISDSFKAAHPQVPWKKIEGQRHRLVHDYGAIIPDLIWEVATVHCPALVREIEPLVPPLPDEESPLRTPSAPKPAAPDRGTDTAKP